MDFRKESQAMEIQRVRREIRKLPEAVRKLIKKGENTIDEGMIFNKTQPSVQEPHEFPHGLNVFNLGDNIPGDVMKYLVMLYTAGGYHNVSIQCSCFHGEGDRYGVKYPNEISFTAKR